MKQSTIKRLLSNKKHMVSFIKSKVTWAFVAVFIVGGLEAVGVISTGVGTALLGILGIGGLASHSSQIKAGSIKVN